MDVLGFTLRKLAYGIPLILGVSFVSFVLMVYFGPDLTFSLVGRNPTVEQLERARERLGYNAPFLLRYLDYLRELATLDFGESMSTGEPVAELLARTVPNSLLVTLPGFVIGNVLGTALGLSLWYSRFVSRVVQPFIIALGSIPIIALAPIVIIWFGTGLASKVAMSTLSVVVVALVTSYKGAMSVDPDQVNLMRTLGARKGQIFRKLVVPASLTDIFVGMKLTVGFALIGAIIGEFMSSSEGLGHAIFKAGSLYIIPKVFAALVATIALALLLTWLVGKLERLLTPWRQES
jgi:NitT/TauT family transport system permease protein